MQKIICDLDMTIADNQHRLHLIKNAPKDYYSFYNTCDRDTPIFKVIDEIRKYPIENVYFVTGREETCREKTLEWLKLYFEGEIKLYMRKLNDTRPAYIVKPELLEEIGIEMGDIAYEDEERNIQVFMFMGLIVNQIIHNEEGTTILRRS